MELIVSNTFSRYCSSMLICNLKL